MLQRVVRSISHRWKMHDRLRYLRSNFRNGEELARSWLDDTPCDSAVSLDGSVIRHPPGRSGFAAMILESWYTDVYSGRFYTPQPGDVIIDAGANIGMFSLRIARSCKDCRVLAFEPFEQNYRLLCENLASAGVDSVQTYPFALSGTSGEATMVDGGKRSQDHRLKLETSDQPAGSVVRTCTIADVLEMAGAETIALFKCDIEGSENRLFAEATPEDFRRIQRFAIEYHDNIQPGTLQLLQDRLTPTHEVTVNPSPYQNCGMLYASSRSPHPAAGGAGSGTGAVA